MLGVEAPIYIESSSHAYRDFATNGLNRSPVHPEEIWRQIELIPPVPPPGLVENGGPSLPDGVVELVAMIIQPVAGSKDKGEFRGWANSAPPTPNPGGDPEISRVIPATFGAKNGAPGPYQPTMSGAPPYDGRTWVVDGIERCVKFPHGRLPASNCPLVLTFYRYTGLTGVDHPVKPANLGWVNTCPPHARTVVPAGGSAIANNSGAPSIFVPASGLAAGCVWELYVTGLMTPSDLTDTGTLALGVTFNAPVGPSPDLSQSACVAKFVNSYTVSNHFEYHATFRVLSISANTLTVTTVGKLTVKQDSDDIVQTDIATKVLSDHPAPQSIDGKIIVTLCAGWTGSAPFVFTRGISYLRRIA
jgi:hypothetical protein